MDKILGWILLVGLMAEIIYLLYILTPKEEK